jgi:hypothetical protein
VTNKKQKPSLVSEVKRFKMQKITIPENTLVACKRAKSQYFNRLAERGQILP